MAAAGQMAEFFATFGFKIKEGDIKRIDKQLNYLEARARRMSEESLSNIKINISRFSFDANFNARLRKALQSRIKLSTTGLNIGEVSIKHFDVDKEALLREMRVAIRYAENNLRFRIRSDILPPRGPAGGLGGHGGGRGGLGAGIGAGAAAGNFGRGLIPGLGVAYGVNQLNKINQELVGQQYAAQAVFGSPEAGQEGLAWLRNFSNEVGQDYRSQGQPYIRMIASATNAGMGVGETQDMYAGISRYGRTMGLGKEDMKGSMRAVEQMLNKQQVYAEELKTQLAEKMPGVISAMAEAVTGDANNTKELFKLMETGNISAMKYLPEFSRILEERALAGGAYEDAIKASTAEQGRFNNVFNDMVKVLSVSGFEEGQQGIFRTLASFFRLTQPLVQAFGEAWVYVGSVIRVPLGLLADLSTGIDKLSEHTGYARGNILALGGIIALLAIPFTSFATGVLLALAGLEDFTAFMSGRESLMGQLLGDSADEVRDNLMGVFESLYDLIDTIVERVEDLFNLFSENSDFKLIDWLNDKIQSLQNTIETIIAILGGDNLKVRTLERSLDGETDPKRRRHLQAQIAEEKKNSNYISNLTAGGSDKPMLNRAVDSIRNNPAFFIPDFLGVDDLLENMMSTEESTQARESSLSQFRQPGGLVPSQYSGGNVTNNFSPGAFIIKEVAGPEETVKAVSESLMKSTADKYQGAAD